MNHHLKSKLTSYTLVKKYITYFLFDQDKMGMHYFIYRFTVTRLERVQDLRSKFPPKNERKLFPNPNLASLFPEWSAIQNHITH